MWICITDGFMSATKRKTNTIDPGDDRDMQVRARDAAHLETLRRVMAAAGQTLGETLTSTKADYQYRAFCTQGALAVGMAALTYEIDYTNFKDTVRENRLHNAYMHVWDAVLDAFPEGSIYGSYRRGPATPPAATGRKRRTKRRVTRRGRSAN